uniref:Conotoxin n=1 Tax=Conus praecellens TaxID=128530 RepID=A0A291C2G6_CONPC|nr:conotoxin [Conus praecellens]
MSTLRMMLLILLLLLPMAAFADDRPTIRGQRSAKFLKSITKRECDQGRPCTSGKWCCDDCCKRSNCGCRWEILDGIRYRVCDC